MFTAIKWIQFELKCIGIFKQKGREWGVCDGHVGSFTIWFSLWMQHMSMSTIYRRETNLLRCPYNLLWGLLGWAGALDAGALVSLYPTTLFYLINALTNSNNKVTIHCRCFRGTCPSSMVEVMLRNTMSMWAQQGRAGQGGNGRWFSRKLGGSPPPFLYRLHQEDWHFARNVRTFLGSENILKGMVGG